MQTAGYEKLHNAIYPNAPIYVRYGLKLKPNGDYSLVEHIDPDAGPAFDAALEFAGVDERRKPFMQKYGAIK